MPGDSLKEIAVIMAVNCVRNTCIENYHAEGKLTDPEMKAFNKEVADRLYTFLEVMLSRPHEEWRAFFDDMAFLSGNAVQTWDKPEFDKQMWRGKDYVPKFDARFTPTQGRYLAFIHQYMQLHGEAPAEADMQEYFRTSPPAVHQMVLTLEKRGLIQRTPGQARSIKVIVPAEVLPKLE